MARDRAAFTGSQERWPTACLAAARDRQLDMKAARRRSAFWPLMCGLIADAWILLWVWEQSPYGRYVDHGRWDEINLVASICIALPAGDVIVPAFLYIAGWLLMSGAMMLPTAFPLIEIFRRLTFGRADYRTLMALLIAGYLSAWTLFGLAAHAADLGLHALVRSSNWLKCTAA
jgi:predicted metal-binding membrane protein